MYIFTILFSPIFNSSQLKVTCLHKNVTEKIVQLELFVIAKTLFFSLYDPK